MDSTALGNGSVRALGTLGRNSLPTPASVSVGRLVVITGNHLLHQLLTDFRPGVMGSIPYDRLPGHGRLLKADTPQNHALKDPNALGWEQLPQFLQPFAMMGNPSVIQQPKIPRICRSGWICAWII